MNEPRTADVARLPTATYLRSTTESVEMDFDAVSLATGTVRQIADLLPGDRVVLLEIRESGGTPTAVLLRERDGQLAVVAGVPEDQRRDLANLLLPAAWTREAVERTAQPSPTPQLQDTTEHAGLVAELRRTVERLERSNQELAGLARITAHDLAAPLRAVSGLIDLLPQADASPDTKLTFDAIRSAIDRMQAMVAGITGYVQTRSEEPRRALVNLNELVGRVRETLESDIQERSASFIVEELPSVFGEEHQLERVFLNLVSNALKYAGEQPPEITVYARRTPGAWSISVADRGIGVKEADRDRIFELFVRGDVESGSGIGLATCRRIVELHGGRIWVEPNEPTGAVFSLTLPDEPTVVGAGGSVGSESSSPAADMPY